MERLLDFTHSVFPAGGKIKVCSTVALDKFTSAVSGWVLSEHHLLWTLKCWSDRSDIYVYYLKRNQYILYDNINKKITAKLIPHPSVERGKGLLTALLI